MVDRIRTDNSGGYAVARFVSSGFLALNSNSVVTGANSSGEVVSRMTISEAFWSCGNGAYFTVARGGNTVFTYSNNGQHDYQAQGIVLDSQGGEAASNVVVTKSGAGPSTLVLKLHKKNFTS